MRYSLPVCLSTDKIPRMFNCFCYGHTFDACSWDIIGNIWILDFRCILKKVDDKNITIHNTFAQLLNYYARSNKVMKFLRNHRKWVVFRIFTNLPFIPGYNCPLFEDAAATAVIINSMRRTHINTRTDTL